MQTENPSFKESYSLKARRNGKISAKLDQREAE